MNFSNEMKLTVKALSQNEAFARSVVGAFFAQLNPNLEQLDDIKTAVSEAVTNCIVHGYQKQGGDIDIFCGIDNNSITITVTDYGKGISDIQQALQPFFTTCSDGERSGMGFTVMKAFCDKVDVQSEPGKTVVTLVKSVCKAE